LGILMPLELPMGTMLMVCDRVVLSIDKLAEAFGSIVITVVTV
jgi:hypothetical protein